MPNNHLDLYTLFEISQIKAINYALQPTLDSIFRIRQRQYSKEFNTPLPEVEKMEPIKVLEALYESQYSPSIVEEELPELLEILYKMKDPNYEALDKEVIEEMVDSVLNREIRRLSKNKPPTQNSLLEAEQAKVKKTTPATPKSGGLDFSELEKQDSITEAPRAGFKPQ